MTAKRLETDSISPGPGEIAGQIIPFRPRTSAQLQLDAGDDPPTENAEPDEDFKHRTLVNVAAFVFLAGLTGAGIWLAASISDLRRTQDCVLANRPNCAQIAVPARR
jgi:hypothetical protein